MTKIRTIIIDDNPHAILGLKEDIARWFPSLEIVGEADGVVAGAKILRQLKPDLLLLDIQMGDGTGFDLLEIVPDLNFQLIFTTAHDEHALHLTRPRFFGVGARSITAGLGMLGPGAALGRSHF